MNARAPQDVQERRVAPTHTSVLFFLAFCHLLYKLSAFSLHMIAEYFSHRLKALWNALEQTEHSRKILSLNMDRKEPSQHVLRADMLQSVGFPDTSYAYEHKIAQGRSLTLSSRSKEDLRSYLVIT